MQTYSQDNLPLEIDGIDVIQNELMAVNCLKRGQAITRFEFGDSMEPFLKSGQFCKLIPLSDNDVVEVGDIVFSMVNGMANTHMVGMKKQVNDEMYYLIVTSDWHIIGWTNTILAKGYGIDHLVVGSCYKIDGNISQIPMEYVSLTTGNYIQSAASIEGNFTYGNTYGDNRN